jgi:hypothetical protein
VRLDPGNAAILFGLVQREGPGATTIVIHSADRLAPSFSALAGRRLG